MQYSTGTTQSTDIFSGDLPYNLSRKTLKSAECPNFATRVCDHLATSDQECLCKIPGSLQIARTVQNKRQMPLSSCWALIFRIAAQMLIFS